MNLLEALQSVDLAYNNSFRNFAITLLDDEYGVNESAWNLLKEKLNNIGASDIVDKVVYVGQRYFLNEDHGLISELQNEN